MNKFLVPALALVLTGCYHDKGTTQDVTQTPATTPSETETTTDKDMVKESAILGELNDSGQSGTATLEEVDGKVVVKIVLTGEESEVAQPAHIHEGGCPEPGDVVYPLNDVVEGESETTIEATMSDLEAMEDLSVNVHKSADELSVYSACGDL